MGVLLFFILQYELLLAWSKLAALSQPCSHKNDPRTAAKRLCHIKPSCPFKLCSSTCWSSSAAACVTRYNSGTSAWCRPARVRVLEKGAKTGSVVVTSEWLLAKHLHVRSGSPRWKWDWGEKKKNSLRSLKRLMERSAECNTVAQHQRSKVTSHGHSLHMETVVFSWVRFHPLGLLFIGSKFYTRGAGRPS